MPSSVAGSSSLFGRLSRSGGMREVKCTVQLLADDADPVEVEFKRGDNGQVIFDYVCDWLKLVERDYFGLRYMDLNKHRYWLDLSKPVFKQIRGLAPIVFRLRVRYYPADPSIVKEEITRYQLFLQVRRDLLHGRLYAPYNDAAFLGACIVQSELGDFDPAEHNESYVSEFKIFLRQSAKLEDKIAVEHKNLLIGLNPAEAEEKFLSRVATLDTYAFDPYTVKFIDHTTNSEKGDTSVFLGITHLGIQIYENSRKLHHIHWPELDKVDYLGKEFRVYPKAEYFKPDLQINNNTADDEKKQNSTSTPEPTMPVVNGQNSGASDEGDSSATSDASPAKVSPPSADASNTTAAAGETRQTGATRRTLKFACPSATFAKHLWRHALGQQAFFTCDHAAQVKPQTSKRRIPVLARGSTFRWDGRVLHEIAGTDAPQRSPPAFARSHVERQPSRDQRAFPWANNNDSGGGGGRYATMPLRSKQKRLDNANNDYDDEGTDEANGVVMLTKARSVEAPPTTGVRPSLLDDSADLSPVAATTTSDGSFSASTPNKSTGSPVDSPNGVSLIANSATYDSRMEDAIVAELRDAATPVAPSKATPPTPTTTTSKDLPPTTTTTASGGGGRGWLRSLLSGLLISLLFVGVVVALMEASKDRRVSGYARAVPGLEWMRNSYYEPSRKYLLNTMRQYTNKA